MMWTRRFFSFLPAIFAAWISVVIGCGDIIGDDDDDEDVYEEDPGCNNFCGEWGDDEWTDDDDDTGEDDTVAGSPVLSDGAWDPPSVTWTADCESDACSTLTWYVCDVENNMLPDGAFFIYAAGTSEAFFVGGPEMRVSDFPFTTTPDFSNCDQPVGFSVGLPFPESVFPQPGSFELSCDIKATDSDGHPSNKLTGITFQITYNG